MFFGSEVEDALRFITGQHAGMLDKLSPVEREQAVGDLRADLTRHLVERGVFYESAAWLVHAR